MKVDQLSSDFKQAMRRLASTVSIVTAGKEDQRSGMVATAVSSVSADPPTLLVVVNQTASIAPILVQEGRFQINILGQWHGDIVGAFSGKKKGLERFEHGNWRISSDGLPVLEDAVATLACKTVAAFSVATHMIYVGEVTSVVCHEKIDPLVWVDGQLARTETFSL